VTIPRYQENIIKTLDMALSGTKSCHDIAEALNCSVKTARRYIWRLYELKYEYQNIDVDITRGSPRGDSLSIKAEVRI